MSKKRIAFGVVTTLAAGPAIAVTVADAGVLTPATSAEMVALPARWPSVTVVEAIPDASVVSEGDESSMPEALARKPTVTPGTPFPFASATFTANAPTDVLTVPLGAGDVVTDIATGGPICGPDASPPHAAATPNAAKARREKRRVTWCVRSRAGRWSPDH